MKHIFGLLMIIWVIILEITGQNVDTSHIASLLGALCVFIIKEKYLDKLYFSVIYFISAVILAQYWEPFILLAAVSVLDFTYARYYYLTLPAIAVAAYPVVGAQAYEHLVLLVAAAFVGYVIGTKDRNEKDNILVLDNERRLRYDLEQARNELIRSRSEIESLTEARERNRIAHELHDSIGHAIAGVLMQLEAAYRINGIDSEKTGEILKLCKDRLAEALELTRDTVYNLRTDVKIGVQSFEKLIKGFTFCPVSFEYNGNLDQVSSSNIKILEANIREALTNASRHSRCSKIEIRIDVSKRNIRLYYKDDGIGCLNIHEGLGLIGMRERVKNAGGTLSIDGGDGFLIVCNLPRHGGNPDEDNDS